jgi:hypothetical protein
MMRVEMLTAVNLGVHGQWLPGQSTRLHRAIGAALIRLGKAREAGSDLPGLKPKRKKSAKKSAAKGS